jgi:hypothetical protein
MRKVYVLLALALAAVAAVPTPGEACGRRARFVRCQPAHPAPAPGYPVVAYPAPYCQPVVLPTPGPAPVAAAPSPVRAVTIKGKHYRLTLKPERPDYEEDTLDVAAEGAVPTGAGANIPNKHRFRGIARRAAKTTIFSGPPKEYETVGALLDELIPTNQAMKELHIPKTPDSKRVDQEKRNVTVQAYIYAFKKEADNDYHVILGDAPGTPDPRYMNAEVSGIPVGGTDENRAKLWAVRKEFEGRFELDGGSQGGYFRPEPPVPVRITGSLFWDVDHQNPPYVGPSGFKPKTPWEIHPIAEFGFQGN